MSNNELFEGMGGPEDRHLIADESVMTTAI